MILAKLNTRSIQSCLYLFVMLVLTFALGSASAEVKLNDNLSISGFLDMSTVTTMGDETETSMSFDQFEMDFHLNYGSVTGQVDIDSTDAFFDQGIKLEQAFVTYTAPKDMLPGVSITAGRILSSLGFEAEEPTLLYQYSYSEGNPHPGYQNGVAVNVKPMKAAGLYVAFVSSVWDVNETDVGTPGIEAQLALTPIEQITAKIGYALDTMDDYTQTELNAWVSFAQGPLILAGEFDLLSNWEADGNNGMHFLGMANVSLADIISVPVGVTVRFSGITTDNEGTSTEFTFSPSYTATDNWLLLAEFKQRLDAEETIIAVESLFTY